MNLMIELFLFLKESLSSSHEFLYKTCREMKMNMILSFSNPQLFEARLIF